MDNSKLPAYPISITREWKEGNDGHMYEVKDDYEGVSKLELFTIAAMQGICANNYDAMPVNEIAAQAVVIAQATLTELSKHQ